MLGGWDSLLSSSPSSSANVSVVARKAGTPRLKHFPKIPRAKQPETSLRTVGNTFVNPSAKGENMVTTSNTFRRLAVAIAPLGGNGIAPAPNAAGRYIAVLKTNNIQNRGHTTRTLAREGLLTS